MATEANRKAQKLLKTAIITLLHSEWPKLWSFGHSECNRIFGHSECNRVEMVQKMAKIKKKNNKKKKTCNGTHTP